MNNTNFTAQELTTLQGSAENLFKEIVESIKAVRDACQHMSGVVKSEDSSLASAWDNVAQAILDPVTKAESSLGAVGKALKSYVDQTVSNEQNAESELGSIDEELGALGKIASGIVDLGSVIGGAAAGVTSGDVVTKHIDGTPGTVKVGEMVYGNPHRDSGPLKQTTSVVKPGLATPPSSSSIPHVRPSAEYGQVKVGEQTVSWGTATYDVNNPYNIVQPPKSSLTGNNTNNAQ